MRCAITIIYNGLHHLKHGDFAHRMLAMFDHWIVVEGHARNGGSTKWCNFLKFEQPGSKDGTQEYLKELSKNNKLHYIQGKGFWESKDAQFQAGIEKLKTLTDKCTLWQVDADEWWTEKQLARNESMMNGTVGMVGFHHVVGKCGDDLLIAKGKWGSALVNRVWKWTGQDFTSHEPATMKGQGKPQPLPEKFLHFSYYFEQDISFKQKYYRNHGIYEGWKTLQTLPKDKFPIHIYKVFGRKSHLGRTNTQIHRAMWQQETGMLL